MCIFVSKLMKWELINPFFIIICQLVMFLFQTTLFTSFCLLLFIFKVSISDANQFLSLLFSFFFLLLF